MKSRKAQSIGSGITWMVATPIIFFILVLFLMVSIASYAKKGGAGEVTTDGTFAEKLILTKKIEGFLSQKVGEKQTVRDLVSGSFEQNQEPFAKFQASALVFLREQINSQIHDNAWIRVYDAGERVWPPSNKWQGSYGNYEAKVSYNDPICEPVAAKNAASAALKILYLEFPIQDKKIAVCVKYKNAN